MEERIPLPTGHILNLNPRGRGLKHAKPDTEEPSCERSNEPATGYKAYRPYTESHEPKPLPESSTRKVTPTRLPMPKKLADKAKDESTDKSPVAGRKEHRHYTLGRRTQHKSSPVSLERRPAKSTDKDREQYWRKVKEKFEKDSPTSSRSRDRPKEYYHGAYQKIMSLAGSPKQESNKHLPKSYAKAGDDDKTPRQSSIPRTTTTGSDSKERHTEPAPNSESHEAKKFESKKRPSNSIDTCGTIDRQVSDKQNSTTDSSINSHPSISPLSGPSSSMTDWEDRFVVNMPSAKEPNPPTMSAQQITNFQKSIDQVHTKGETMLDPDTLPSPRTRTPEDALNSPETQGKKPGNLDGDSGAGPTGQDGTTSEPQSNHGRYYSPDEIGKQRFSTIWEEGTSRHKTKTTVNIDGSFLGCKEMNGPNDKNPDEILLFSTTDERPRVVDVSAPVSKTARERKTADPPQAISALEEKTVVQEEWKPISQNLKHAQCSKQFQHTLCREKVCQPLEAPQMSATKASGKENSTQIGILPKNQERRKPPAEDDVFIITPTITRTMLTMADMRDVAQKTSRTKEPASRAAGEIITDTRAKAPMPSTPSGLRRATQNSWEKSNTPSTTLSKPGPNGPNLPAVKEQHLSQVSVEKPRAIRGFIHTRGIVKSSTENINPRARINRHSHTYETPRNNENAPPVRSATDPTQFPRSVSAQKTMSPPKLDTNVLPERRIPLPTARIFEVAELDGHQVDDHQKDGPKGQETAPEMPAAKDAVTTNKSSIESPESPESPHDHDNDKDLMSSVTFGLIIDIFFLSIAQAQGLCKDIMANWNSRAVLAKIALNCILNMVGHCLYVLRNFLAACSVYNSTGSWPKLNDKELTRSLTDLGQAVIYLIALGFIMMAVGRAAGYIVLVGSWIVWVTKPFGWVLGTLGKALLT